MEIITNLILPLDIYTIIFDYYDLTEFETIDNFYKYMKDIFYVNEINLLWNRWKKNSIKNYFTTFYYNNKTYFGIIYEVNNILTSIDDIPNIKVYTTQTKYKINNNKDDFVTVSNKDFLSKIYFNPYYEIPEKGILCEWFKNNELYRRKNYPKLVIQDKEGEDIFSLWTEMSYCHLITMMCCGKQTPNYTNYEDIILNAV